MSQLFNKRWNFLVGSFNYGDNVRPQSNLDDQENPSILKDNFSQRKGPSIFTIAPVLLDRSNETS